VNSSPRRSGRLARAVDLRAQSAALAEALEPRVCLSAPVTMMEEYSGLTARVATGDVNGDGTADLIALTASKGKNKALSFTVDVQLGKGDGTFAKAVTVETIPGEPVGVAVGDIDGDGDLDLALFECNELKASATILLGSGDGTFAKPVVSVNVPQVEAIANMSLADVNGDGDLDLALFECNEGTLIVHTQLGKGDGTFAAPTSFAYQMGGPGMEIEGIALAQFNGDGRADLALIQDNGFIQDDGFILLTLAGNGDGTFQDPVEAASFTSSDGPRLAVGDFNGDGLSDAFVLGNLAPTGSVTHYLIGLLLPGDGQGAFDEPIKTTVNQVVKTDTLLLAGDVNGDGLLDLLLVGAHGPNIYTMALLGNGKGNVA
jgi:hypothetical protein